VFEPPWEPSALPRAFLFLPNMLETFFCLREAETALLRRGDGGGGVDGLNRHFMARFVQLHSEVEASSRPARHQRGPSVAAAAPSGAGRPDLAAAGARAAWAGERPPAALHASWAVTPHACQVVQARRAEHHDRGWLQVTVRLTAEERWMSRGGSESRLREHFVVLELPRAGSSPSLDFRIAEIRLDARPT